MSDLQDAQEIMFRALKHILLKCGLIDKPDFFLAIVMAAYSRAVAEFASDAKVMAPGGIDAMIKFTQEELGRMMREDFDRRLTRMGREQAAASKH